MQQEDYIKRQIDQLGRALGKILAELTGLKTQEQVNEGIESAGQTLKNELGFNIADLTIIPGEDFITALQDGRQWSNDNFDKLADILFLLAEELYPGDQEKGKKKKLYDRALILYEHLDATSSTYSFDRHVKMEKIKNES